jgi:large subunit ribosomal protein L29
MKMVVNQMKVKEIRELSTDEINTKLVETKQELFNLRFQQATGNLEKPSRLRDLRHTVARMKTVLKEREATK